MDTIILTRYGEPSKYDYSPYGSICKVIKATSEEFDIFVQLSYDEEHPQWNFVESSKSITNKELLTKVKKIINES